MVTNDASWFQGEAAEAALWRDIIMEVPGYDPIATRGDCYFDPVAAAKAIAFIETTCKHSEGPLAGQYLELEDWQRGLIANLFGWKRPDGMRRYTYLFLYVPRKNGKTMLAAAIVVYVAFCDDEGPGSGKSRLQINGCAGDASQAALTFSYAVAMIEEEMQLKRLTKIYDGQVKRFVRYPDATRAGTPMSVYKVLSTKKAAKKHGLNTHLGIIDESHAFENGELPEAVKSSIGSRSQPLIVEMTTADFDRPNSYCNDTLDFAKQVRDGIRTGEGADSVLPYIYSADIEDDWTDPEIWKSANPNYGISVNESFLRAECSRAHDNPRLTNTFKRLYLNITTSQATQWIPLHRWDACRSDFTREELEGKPCYAGLDLSSARDLAAFVLVFPKNVGEPDSEEDQSYKVLPFFWIPGRNIKERSEEKNIPYMSWIDKGLAKVTPGRSRVDYRLIRDDIRELAEEFRIIECGFDPWQAEQMSQELADPETEARPITMVKVIQTYASLNNPCREFESAIYDQRFLHNGNDVLRWMVPRVQVHEIGGELIKPDRKNTKAKIDGVAGTINALHRAIAGNIDEEDSVYEERGVIQI